MRLLLTAVGTDETADLALDCDDDATIGDLSLALASHLHLDVPSVVQPVSGNPLGVVSATQTTAAPTLWWNGQPLDPTEPITTSSLRHGAIVGIGTPVGDVLAEPAGAVEVRVGSGRGAGRVRRLAPGSYPLGSGPESVLPLADPDLPQIACWIDVDARGRVAIRPEPATLGATRPAPYRAHPLEGPIVVPSRRTERRRRWWRRWSGRRAAARAALADRHETVDPQQDVPLLHLEREPVRAPTMWPPGTVLACGRELVELEQVRPPDASLSPSLGGATLDYNRPPRLLPPPRVTDFALPSEPKQPEKMPIPLAMMIAPTIMAGGMYWLTKSPFSLLFAGMTPIMALSTFTSGRRVAKKQYKSALADWARRRRRVRDDAYTALVTEREQRRHDLADPAELLVTATGPRARLWERRRTDPDWLLARVGTADVPSEVSVRDPERELHEGPLSWTAPDVPVAVPLADVGVTGVAGPDVTRRAIGSWIVAQAAVLHSPADLDIVLLADADGAADWSWLRWVPHARAPEDAGFVAQMAGDEETIGQLLRVLLKELADRTAAANTPGNRASTFDPILVVLDGARRLRLMPGMVSLLQSGPTVGIYFLCLDADRRQLPEECRAVVAVADARTDELTVSITGRPDVEGVRPDLVDPTWRERVARALAPVRDVSSEDLSGSLPRYSRLLNVLGMPTPDPVRITAQWQRAGRTTRAVIGEGLDGPFAIDIRADGPHGLIAGTTGSGKSELLQTMIAALSIGNRPDELTFVLVDYKGGAAFKDCNKLPHTVGMVTDLDGHLTTRALESLGAELRRREHILARAGAKDIEDYLSARGPDDEPLPRLMIVIDEFAALKSELPDFVDGLVDVARRGRSLGVHLILATQRPAGVISAEIKSNTTLRIALRVTDANDSQDVIESGEAAAISKSTRGRAYARLGQSLVPFQASRVGGRPRIAGERAGVVVRPLSWNHLAAVHASAAPEAGDEDDVSIPTDLATLVGAITAATEVSQVATPPSPWLPPLPDLLTLDDAYQLAATDHPDDIAPLVFGMADVPAQQRRSAAAWDPVAAGHLCVVGAPRSGRSTALRAIAGSIGQHVTPRDLHVYGVDCGNNALLPLLSLPHTGAVVTREQVDRVSRLTARLLQTIAGRQQLLAERGYADVREQRAHAADSEKLPYLVVLFDRWEAFVAAYDSIDTGRLIEDWMQILQEGPGAGVKVVMTADRSALVGRISTLIDDKVLLKLIDPGDFGAIGLRPKDVPTTFPPGRGFRAEGVREVQVALLNDDPKGTAQVLALQEIGRRAAAAAGALVGAQRPFRVDALPSSILLADAHRLPPPETSPSADELPVAVGGDSLMLLGFDPVEHGPGLLFAGPKRSGRSTALLTLAAAAADRDWPLVVITPRRSPLQSASLGSAVRFPLDAAQADVVAALAALRASEHSLLVVDDLELVGLDGWLANLIVEHLAALRDKPAFVAAAGPADEFASSYRGPASVLKKSRSGLLLAPQVPSDGDLFGLRLSRSVVGGPAPAGRGLLVRNGISVPAQVVKPD